MTPLDSAIASVVNTLGLGYGLGLAFVVIIAIARTRAGGE